MGTPLQVVGAVIFVLYVTFGFVDSAHPWSPTHLENTPSCNYSTTDLEILQFSLNVEYLEGEYLLNSVYGYGLDKAAPSLVGGGPKPIGVQKVNLTSYYYDILEQLALEEIGHIRYNLLRGLKVLKVLYGRVWGYQNTWIVLWAIKNVLGKTYDIPRPQMDVSKTLWAEVMNMAFNTTLSPPFDPYTNSLNFIISTYSIPYTGLLSYVGFSKLLQCPAAKLMVARLLGIEAGQDTIIRAELYRLKDNKVPPYEYTVANFTDALSNLTNLLSNDVKLDDEGLEVPKALGPEGKLTGNILSADADSLAYFHFPQKSLQYLYGSANASEPGAYFPKGCSGVIAKSYLS